MTATAHILVGAAISASIKDPSLGIGLSLISHPILDLIPHWDFGWNWREKTRTRLFIEAAVDVLVGFGVAYFLFGSDSPLWYFLACTLASIAADLAECPYWFLKWRFPPFSWIYNLQSRMQGKAKLPWGIVSQLISVGLIVWLLQAVR